MKSVHRACDTAGPAAPLPVTPRPAPFNPPPLRIGDVLNATCLHYNGDIKLRFNRGLCWYESTARTSLASRVTLVNALVDIVCDTYQRDQPIEFVSYGFGGLLTEFLIDGQLQRAGFLQRRWCEIDLGYDMRNKARSRAAFASSAPAYEAFGSENAYCERIPHDRGGAAADQPPIIILSVSVIEPEILLPPRSDGQAMRSSIERPIDSANVLVLARRSSDHHGVDAAPCTHGLATPVPSTLVCYLDAAHWPRCLIGNSRDSAVFKAFWESHPRSRTTLRDMPALHEMCGEVCADIKARNPGLEIDETFLADATIGWQNLLARLAPHREGLVVQLEGTPSIEPLAARNRQPAPLVNVDADPLTVACRRKR